MTQPAQEGPEENPRRSFLVRVPGASGALAVPTGFALVPIGAVAVSAAPAAAGQPGVTSAEEQPGYESLNPDEAAFVEAMVNVMCLANELTANGVDFGLATYIDRQLAGGFGRGDRLYRAGPWAAGKPQLGYQLPLTPEEFFKAGSESVQAACVQRSGKRFEELASSEPDGFLKEIASGRAFNASSTS